jgi:hypothetical protein
MDLSLADELQKDVVSEIARLRAAIAGEAATTDRMLNDHPLAGQADWPRWGAPEHRELNRQLAALDERVARAQARGDDRLLLRAELATLLSFAKVLRADAEAWRRALPEGLEEVERRQAATRAERKRLAAERAALVERRDALRGQISQTARRVAQDSGGECRPTVPVFALAEDLSVCSVSVKSPRRGFRPGKWWLITLSESGDEVVVR